MFPGTTITTAVFILFPLTLYLAAAATTDIHDYLALGCKTTSSDDLFSANSTYASNLDSLLSNLSNSLTNSCSGFATSTAGSTPSTTVYGLALCRGDASSDNCTTCFSLAKLTLRANCSGIKEAIVWREWCMLRYANRRIFSFLEFDPAFTLNNGNTIVAGAHWNQALKFTLRNVMGRAAAASGDKKFATKEAAYMADGTSNATAIYSLAQCTPDLTARDCSKCLINAMLKFPLQYQAGIVLLPSCHIRYDPHPFYQNFSVPELLPPTPAPMPAPAPAPPPAGKNSSHSGVAEKVGIPTAIGISVLLGIGGWYYKHYNGNPLNGSEDVDMTGNPSAESLQMDFNEVCAATDQNLALDRELGEDVDMTGNANAESLQMDFNEVCAATDQNLAQDRELGEGEFEEAYKGKLANGQEIEAKRLSRSNSRHGRRPKQFKKEVAVIAKIQHRNLVKLLGFCQKDKDKILVYESLPNSSTLEKVLFDDPIKRASLGWEKRFNIICGIAKGLLYLHHDSRLRIVHRDLKPSSILLDEEAMNPQISDFGKAKMLELDQTRASSDTRAAAKTHAYMAPEYKSTGKYSFNSDIYSFGIIVLEIVTGQRNHDEDRSPLEESMLHRARRLWSENKKLEIIDSTLKDYSIEEVVKCIHIGLLCIQEDDEKRPTITSIEATLIGIGKSTDLPQVDIGRPPN